MIRKVIVSEGEQEALWQIEQQYTTANRGGRCVLREAMSEFPADEGASPKQREIRLLLPEEDTDSNCCCS